MTTAKSSDEEVNPYASPIIPGGYDPRSALGIGVWRDGDFLVLHDQATLPFFCVVTGEPAFRFRTFVLDWTSSFDFWRRQQQLLLPLSKEAYRRFRQRENMATAALVVPIFTLVHVYLTCGSSLAPAWYLALVGMFMGGLVWAEILRRKDRKLLRFVAKKDRYLWIVGADPRFLAQLPDWPLPGAT